MSGVAPRILLLLILLVLSAASTTSAQPSTSTDALQPGDMIRVAISAMPDMSGDYVVDELGQVSLPLIGTRQASGLPAGELRRQLLAEYNSQFRNQSIQVTFLRRISVLGQVKNPGLYHADPTMSVSDVLALAGGPTEQGRPDEVRILRGDSEIRADVTSTETLPPELRSGDQLFVPRKSWFTRNGTYAVGIGLAVLGVITRALN
jgi:polysaccharide export outer membrane protein